MKMKTPTQLDVVRISGDESAPQDLSRPTMPPESPSTSAASADPSSTSASVEDKPPQQFCLRWNNYQSNLTAVFDQLLQSESFVDVTLACDGHSMKAHKMVLSACSPYFRTLFFENPCQHPIVIMRDIKWAELKAAVEFMYKGEINVSQDQIGPLLRVAESLKIRGLADVGGDAASASETAPPKPPKKPNGDGAPPPPKARKRHHPGPPPQQSPAVLPLPPLPAVPPPMLHADDMEIKPGIAEMIREEERDQQLYLHRFKAWPVNDCDLADMSRPYKAKLLESSQAWLGASTSSLADYPGSLAKPKAPTWTQVQLQKAIQSVVTQRMRFTQAATKYNIPKGTLYDNILGKTKRMVVLEEAGLTFAEEREVLEFCCEVAAMPHNRRTRKPLAAVLSFVESLRRRRDPAFTFTGLAGFRWWWAFCKKHAIVSLFYDYSSPLTPSSPDSRSQSPQESMLDMDSTA